jgi:hypothetical protein
MSTQAHALSSPANVSTSSLRNASTPTAWFARMKQHFVIEFGSFDDLDLGTPEEFDTYVGELFERGPHVRS